MQTDYRVYGKFTTPPAISWQNAVWFVESDHMGVNTMWSSSGADKQRVLHQYGAIEAI